MGPAKVAEEAEQHPAGLGHGAGEAGVALDVLQTVALTPPGEHSLVELKGGDGGVEWRGEDEGEDRERGGAEWV